MFNFMAIRSCLLELANSQYFQCLQNIFEGLERAKNSGDGSWSFVILLKLQLLFRKALHRFKLGPEELCSCSPGVAPSK